MGKYLSEADELAPSDKDPTKIRIPISICLIIWERSVCRSPSANL